MPRDELTQSVPVPSSSGLYNGCAGRPLRLSNVRMDFPATRLSPGVSVVNQMRFAESSETCRTELSGNPCAVCNSSTRSSTMCASPLLEPAQIVPSPAATIERTADPSSSLVAASLRGAPSGNLYSPLEQPSQNLRVRSKTIAIGPVQPDGNCPPYEVYPPFA